VVDGQLDAILDHVAHRRQRPAWRATLRSFSMTAKTMRFPRVAVSPAWRVLAVAGAILALILATLLAVGGRPFGPPTNGRIVFGRFDSAQDDTVLYTVNPDGSHLLQLRPEAHECPHWSPDGKRITTTDFMMNGDGTGFRPLVNLPGPLFVGCGVWSADQRSIVAQGFNDTDPSQTGLYSLRSSDGGGLHQLTTSTNGRHDIPIGVAPDGRSIAFTRAVTAQGSPLLFLADADGTNARQVGDLVVDAGDWAPDGRSILVASGGRLYSVDIATGKATAVFMAADPNEGNLGNPQWSPDGTRILFFRMVDVGGGQTQSDLFQMRADGTDVIQVTNDPDADYYADWGTYPLVN
jgi:Tol biopolymer transport system component